MKVADLSGRALDWAVAKCEKDDLAMARIRYPNKMRYMNDVAPSKYWDQGGPIIERESIRLVLHGDGWQAWCNINYKLTGPTPLIAAMRCYVASKLGEDVDIPQELQS